MSFLSLFRRYYHPQAREQWKDYRCRLGSLGKSSTSSGSNDPGVCRLELYELLSLFTLLFLPPASVSLIYFILVVPMRKCLGKHSCISSPFPIALPNGPCFFLTVQLHVHTVYLERKTKNSCALVNLCLWTKLPHFPWCVSSLGTTMSIVHTFFEH